MKERFDQLLLDVKPLGYYAYDDQGDIYTAAIREWVAHQIRRRGHCETTRGKIRHVTFDYDEPWGSDVTPPSPKVVSLVCELEDKSGGHWTRDGFLRHEEPVDLISPSQLVVECSAIASKLAWLARVGATDARPMED